jgi:membrane protein involved in colicin uptake
MFLRSKSRVPNSASSSSTVSSNTVRAQVLAAEADHLRRIADIDQRAAEAERVERETTLAAERAERERTLAAERAERERTLAAERAERERTLAAERAERERTLAAERAVVEAEHRAPVASLEAQSNGSRRSTNRAVQDRLNGGDDNPPNVSLLHPQTPLVSVDGYVYSELLHAFLFPSEISRLRF